MRLAPEALGSRNAEDFVTWVTEQIVITGAGQVRKIALIGSRAKGQGTPMSDFDFVVVVERTQDAKRWGGADADAARSKFLLALGPLPHRLDITVRSGEQYEEARSLFGGVEELIDREGRLLFQRAFSRPQLPHRTSAQVRCALVRSWLEASTRTLTSAMESSSVSEHAASSVVMNGTKAAAITQVMFGTGPITVHVRVAGEGKRVSISLAERSCQQALAALCVLYQVPSTKNEPMSQVVERIRHCPQAVRGQLLSFLAQAAPTTSAVSFVRVVSAHLLQTYPRDASIVAIHRQWSQWGSPPSQK